MVKDIPDIIIADDHDMFRDALRTMLEVDSIANVVTEASNGLDLLRCLETYTPDIVLMDIDMPKLNGIEATIEISATYPKIKVLALSMYGDERYYKEMIEAGAMGFILKSSNKSELERAIATIYGGQSYFSNELLISIIANNGISNKTDEITGTNLNFTNREVELIQNLCLGLSTTEIADRLFLSAKTIENYRVKLLKKTKCKNSVELVVYALKNRIISL